MGKSGDHTMHFFPDTSTQEKTLRDLLLVGSHRSFLEGGLCLLSHSPQSIIAAGRLEPWKEWAVPLKSDAIVNPHLSISCVQLLSSDQTTYVGLSFATPTPKTSFSIQVALGKRTKMYSEWE